MNECSAEYIWWAAVEIVRSGLHRQSGPFIDPKVGICTLVWFDPYIMLTMGQLSWSTKE